MADGKVDKVAELNNMMMGIENELLTRAVERKDAQLDSATEFINGLASDGVIDVECSDCDDDDDSHDVAPDGDSDTDGDTVDMDTASDDNDGDGEE